jgi:hypothetical protein
MSRGKTEAIVLVALVVASLLTGTLLFLILGGAGVGIYHAIAGRRFERELRDNEGWQGYGWRGDDPK